MKLISVVVCFVSFFVSVCVVLYGIWSFILFEFLVFVFNYMICDVSLKFVFFGYYCGVVRKVYFFF